MVAATAKLATASPDTPGSEGMDGLRFREAVAVAVEVAEAAASSATLAAFEDAKVLDTGVRVVGKISTTTNSPVGAIWP